MRKLFIGKIILQENLLILLMAIFFFNIFYSAFASENSYKLIINITNRKYNAPFYIALYDNKKSFLKPALAKYAFILDSNRQDIYILDNISAGSYSVALFQDINGNGRLDTLFFGLPKEPFGFSNNPRLIIGPPAFKDCQIMLFDDTIIEIKLR